MFRVKELLLSRSKLLLSNCPRRLQEDYKWRHLSGFLTAKVVERITITRNDFDGSRLREVLTESFRCFRKFVSRNWLLMPYMRVRMIATSLHSHGCWDSRWNGM